MRQAERRQAPLTRLRRRTAIAAAGLLIVFLGQMAIAFAVLALTRDNTKATTEQAFTLVSDSTMDRVVAFLDSVESSVNATVVQLETRDLDIESGTLQADLFSRFRSEPQLRSLYVGYPNGDFAFVRRSEQGVAFDVWTTYGDSGEATFATWSYFGEQISVEPGPIDYDPRLRPWYSTAVGSTGVVWSDPYIFALSERPGTTASRAIYRNGEVVAVVGADIELARIGEMLSSLPLGDSGEAFLLAGDRTLIAAPNSYADQIDDYAEQLGVAVPATAIGVETDIALSVRDVDVVYGEDGSDITLERWLPTEYGLPWILHIRTDRESLAPQNYLFERAMVGFGAAVIGVSALGAIAYAWMWRPFRELRAQAARTRGHVVLESGAFTLNGGARLSELQVEHRPMVVALFAIEGLSSVNETLGHDAGDNVLQAAAEALSEFTRYGDVTGRLSTTEFAVAMPEPYGDATFRTVDRIRATLGDCARAAAPRIDGVNVTAGYVVSGPEGDSFTSLLADARASLEGGRGVGRGRTFEYLPVPAELD